MADVIDTQVAPEAQDAPLDQKITNALNAAVASHLKRVLPKVLEDSMSGIREQIAGFAPKAPASAAAPAGNPADDVAKQLADMQAELRKERDARARDKHAANEARVFNDLRAELTGKVRPEAVDIAAKFLFHADKRVKVGSDGTATFAHGDMEHDLKSGVAEWVRSKDASMFVPAPVPAKRGAPVAAPQRGAAPATTTQQGRPDPLAKTLSDLGLS